MGYRKKNRTVLVRFAEDHDLYGLEARFTGMNIGTFMRITGADGGEEEGYEGTLRRLAEYLIEWNLEEEDGTPVPTTPEAVAAQDTDLILTLHNAWLDGINGVHKDDPLPQGSPNGEPSLVASIPTETMSPSLAS